MVSGRQPAGHQPKAATQHSETIEVAVLANGFKCASIVVLLVRRRISADILAYRIAEVVAGTDI
jgi:hypothetical protein